MRDVPHEPRPETGRWNRDGAVAPGAWSGLAVAASLAMVAFAVLFGIYGPPLGDRRNQALGTPLLELADSTALTHGQLVFEAAHALVGSGEKPPESAPRPEPSLAEVSAATSRIVGRDVRVPDLSAHGFRPLMPTAVGVVGTPAGEAAANVVFVRGERGGRDYLSITFLRDDDQFIVYDDFGRPRFMPINQPIPIDISQARLGQRIAIAWTDGTAVRVAHASNADWLEEIFDALVAGLTLGGAGSDNDPPPATEGPEPGDADGE